MATKPRTRTTRTKTQTKEKLDEIRNEVRESKDRVSSLAEKAETDRVRAATAGLSVDNILKNITVLGPQLQKGLLEITNLLTEKVQELEDVRSAISLAKQELKEVHDIEVVATSLENLLEEFKERETSIEASIAELQQKYKDMDAQLNKSFQEKSDELAKTRQREQTEFNYKLGQDRLKEQNSYQQSREDIARSNKLQQEELEKGWREREAALKAKEAEFNDLKAKVEAFPATLKSELAANSAQIHNATKRDLTNEFNLKEKDFQAKISLLEAKVEQAEIDKTAMAKTINDLQTRLENSAKQVGDIATKALESASGNLAMAKMKEVIDSNGTTPGGKRS